MGVLCQATINNQTNVTNMALQFRFPVWAGPGLNKRKFIVGFLQEKQFRTDRAIHYEQS